jgi:hypothetical protein
VTTTCPAGAVATGPVCLRAPSVNAAAVHAATDQILSERQFAPPSQPWWQRAIGWVDHQLGRLFGHPFGAHGLNGPTQAIDLVLAGVVTVIVLLLVVRFARRVRTDPGVEMRAQAGPRRPAAEWAAEADRHQAAGEWRQALRCRYRALVAELAQRGVVEEIPGRTARDYARLVGASRPGLAGPFGEASALFEAAWYGSRTSSQAQHDRFTALAAQVLGRGGP